MPEKPWVIPLDLRELQKKYDPENEAGKALAAALRECDRRQEEALFELIHGHSIGGGR